MKNFYFIISCISFFSVIQGSAQTNLCGQDLSYIGGTVCSNCAVSSTTVTYGTIFSTFDFPQNNTGKNLKMDVYYLPYQQGDPDRPFILLLHGGGLRFGCRSNMRAECEEFARRGFVAATIDYRLGWLKINASDQPITCTSHGGIVTDYGDDNNDAGDEFCVDESTFTDPNGARYHNIFNNNIGDGGICEPCTNGDLTEQNRALYRALQDAHAALRYVVHYSSSQTINIILIIANYI